MNVLFKRDLDKFSDIDILSLSKMYNLSGDMGDLKWLIAIKYSQKAQMLPFGDHEQALILENLDDDALRSMCQIKGYDDLCEKEYKRRLSNRYPDIEIEGTARATFNRIKRVESLQEWLQENTPGWFPPSFWTLKRMLSLKSLELPDLDLVDIPDTIGELRDLENLALNDNWIKKIPESIGNLTNLQILSLENNKIRELPDSIGNLRLLNYLSLADNKISKLPDSIGNLSNLESLYLSGNNMSAKYIKELKTKLPKVKIFN